MDKRCKHCGTTKLLDEFYADSAARDGRCPECKAALGHLAEDESRIRALTTYLFERDPEMVELATLTSVRLASLRA